MTSSPSVDRGLAHLSRRFADDFVAQCPDKNLLGEAFTFFVEGATEAGYDNPLDFALRLAPDLGGIFAAAFVGKVVADGGLAYNLERWRNRRGWLLAVRAYVAVGAPEPAKGPANGNPMVLPDRAGARPTRRPG